MISIISPAKNMKRDRNYKDCNQLTLDYELTVPGFLHKTERLWKQLKEYNPWELESLMKINEQLSVQAFMDFQDFSLKDKGSAALLTYDGLVFKNIEAEKFTKEELLFANEHLRIMSAFYGLLHPLDGIMPYRLEMQCMMKIEGKNLYKFWQDDLYQQLSHTGDIIVNLASEEYAKCIRKYLQDYDRFIDVEFLVMKKGKLKNVATWAKMARGQMVRYIVTEKIECSDRLKEFSWNGYTFEPSLSYSNKYVFIL